MNWFFLRLKIQLQKDQRKRKQDPIPPSEQLYGREREQGNNEYG
jgi:hypothetical protein